jgi:3-hydroxyacyl-[acyl-carrier-protein] dehydratase
MVLTNQDVVTFLPHRDPFLFIDSVESVLTPGGGPLSTEPLDLKQCVGIEVVAHYRTRADHPIFAGHFPGNPILPGVVQVEMMAQATSFAIIPAVKDFRAMKLDVALLSVSEAKFRKPILPEMDLVIKTSCVKVRGPMMSSDCKIFVNDQLMSEASVMASIR